MLRREEACEGFVIIKGNAVFGGAPFPLRMPLFLPSLCNYVHHHQLPLLACQQDEYITVKPLALQGRPRMVQRALFPGTIQASDTRDKNRNEESSQPIAHSLLLYVL